MTIIDIDLQGFKLEKRFSTCYNTIRDFFPTLNVLVMAIGVSICGYRL